MAKTWICINKSDGRVVGTWGPSDADPPAETEQHFFVDATEHQGYSVLDVFTTGVADIEQEDGSVAHKTVAAGRTPAPAPADYGPAVDPREFMMLFTSAQRKAIRAASANDADVDDLMRLVDVPVAIRLRHPVTLGGLQLLASKNLIDAADVDRISNGLPPQG